MIDFIPDAEIAVGVKNRKCFQLLIVNNVCFFPVFRKRPHKFQEGDDGHRRKKSFHNFLSSSFITFTQSQIQMMLDGCDAVE